MVGEGAPTNQNAVGAGSPTIYETHKQSHKPARRHYLYEHFFQKFMVHFYSWFVGAG